MSFLYRQVVFQKSKARYVFREVKTTTKTFGVNRTDISNLDKRCYKYRDVQGSYFCLNKILFKFIISGI